MRSKQEIRADILTVAIKGVNKTHLVYGTYLNFKIVNQHLTELMNDNRIIQIGKRYFTTESGLEYINHMKMIT